MTVVLVVNAGSSSLKYALVDPVSGARAAGGVVERIGETESLITHEAAGGQPEVTLEQPVTDHRLALAEVRARLDEIDAEEPVAVGHRVVHGGARFTKPVIITDEVVRAIEDCVPLAPLHNPACLSGIHAAGAAFPDVPQIAVFDTAFHATMPPAAREYALDREVARTHRLRRYGFHGTSHQYVTQRAARFLGGPLDECNAVSLHLGNGASACAVRGGRSVDTSMGVTPLEGLVMGTRSGDIDPSIPTILLRAGYSDDDVDGLLNRRSGLAGVAGVNDMREIHAAAAAGDESAALARDLMVHRLRKYVGAYLFLLGRVDALIFTAGIGQHDAWTRAAVCSDTASFGVAIDPDRNASVSLPGPGSVVDISAAPGAGVSVLVVATDEEHAIAEQSWEILETG
jgi:acetate kinase